MRLAPRALAVLLASGWRLAAPARLGEPGIPSAALLQGEERDEREHRTHFEEWCRSESESQAGHRHELLKAREQAASPEGSAVLLDTLSRQATSLAGLLEHRRGEVASLVQRRSRAALALQHLEKQVEALSFTKGQLERGGRGAAGAAAGGAGRSSFLQVQVGKAGSLKIVSELLQRAQSRRQQVASEVAKDPDVLQREVDLLEVEFQSNTSGVAALKATRKASLKLQELILSALEDEDAFLADLDSICRLGQTVYGRMEAEIPKMLEGVLRLMAQSAEELRTSTTPTTSPPPPPLPPTTTPPALQAVRAVQAAQPVQPVQPAQPVQVAQVVQVAQPPQPPQPARAVQLVDPDDDTETASVAQPAAAAAMPARQRQQRLDAAEAHPPSQPPQPQLPVDDGEDETTMQSTPDPPTQSPPAKHQGRAQRRARAAALQTEIVPAPVEVPLPTPRKKAATRAVAEEDETLEAAPEPMTPAPPAHSHRRGTKVAITTPPPDDLDMDAASDAPMPPEPKKKTSPKQRGIEEAKRLEAQFDDDDDSSVSEVKASGPARGDGPGSNLRADQDRLAQLQEHSGKAGKGADADNSDTEEEEAAPPVRKKRRVEATTTPLADPLADDGNLAPAPPPPKRHRQATTTLVADPSADDDSPAPAPPPPPRKHRQTTTTLVADPFADDDSSAPAPPPPPRKHRQTTTTLVADPFADDDSSAPAPPPPPPKKHHQTTTTLVADPFADDDSSAPAPPPPPRKHRQTTTTLVADPFADDDSSSPAPPPPPPKKHHQTTTTLVADPFADDDSSAPAPPPQTKKHHQATTTLVADPFADDDAPAPGPPPKKKTVQTTTTLVADPFADDDAPAPAPPPRKKRVQATTTPLADPFADDDAEADPPPARKKRHASASQAAEEPAFDQQDANVEDADAQGAEPAAPSRHIKQRAAAAAQDEEPADDDSAPTPRNHHHAAESSADPDAAVPSAPTSSDAEISPKGVPNSLRGGWKAMMKGKKPKKHAFHDQTSGIMDLVQTPTTYTAWHPEHSDTSMASSAKNDLLAAEKAFDTSAGADDGGAASFVQLSSSAGDTILAWAEPGAPILLQVEAAEVEAQPSIPSLPLLPEHVEEEPPPVLLAAPAFPFASLPFKSSPQASIDSPAPATSAAPGTAAVGEVADAASLLLEQYAHSLGSASLMQLARSRPNLAGLQKLWLRLSATDTSTSNGHDAETSRWCQDFERQTEALSRAASNVRSQAKTGLAAANAEHKALEEEEAVRKHILEVFRLGSKSLTGMLARVKKRGESTLALFKSLQNEVHELLKLNSVDRDANVSAKVAVVQETIGRAEGLSASGDAEVEDIISAAISRRSEVERTVQSGVAKLQARIHALDKRRAELRRAASPPVLENSQQSTEALKEHYGQMCKWTLDEIQAKKLHAESEKDAIRAALAILEAR